MTDQLRPPGYYVPDPTTGRCRHCGEVEVEHTTWLQFCPRAPLEFQDDELRGAAA